MQKHIPLILGGVLTIGLLILLVFAYKNGTLNIGASADFFKLGR